MIEQPYSLSFTASSLRKQESLKLASLHLQYGNWDAVRNEVIKNNILQQRTTSSAKRIYHELVARLRHLSEDELTLPSRETCLRLLMAKPETLSQSVCYLLTTLLNFDVLQTLHDLAQDFASMLRKLETETLDSWLNRCMNSGIKACRYFAESLLQDYEAVRSAVGLFWSNGQTEGQVGSSAHSTVLQI